METCPRRAQQGEERTVLRLHFSPQVSGPASHSLVLTLLGKTLEATIGSQLMQRRWKAPRHLFFYWNGLLTDSEGAALTCGTHLVFSVVSWFPLC